MCGLVGLVNRYSTGMYKQQHEIFSTLLLIDYLRGADSTGIFGIHAGGDVLVAKEACDPITFMQTDAYDNIMRKTYTRGNALIGHNRKATRGNINDENAHPFIVDDNIVLVHNGTMFGDHKKIADVEVDSHAIAHAIHEGASVEEALSSFDAAYALIWFDVKQQTLNFVRNSQRPLWFMETASSIIWASEKCMLDFVTDKHSLTVTTKPSELTPDMHQVLSLKNNLWTIHEAEKLDLKKKVTYTPPANPGNVFGPQRGNRHPYANGYYNMGEDDEDDVPWEQVVGAQQVETKPELPDRLELVRRLEESLPTSRIRATPAGRPLVPALMSAPPTDSAIDLSDWERKLCHKMNKTIPLRQWQAITESLLYEKGKRILACTFEYQYKNLKDPKDGFVVYSHLLDDEDIVIRHMFAPGMSQEERVMQIAGSNYIYSYIIGRKEWRAFSTGNTSNETPGYVIFEGESATLVEGGGMSNPEIKVVH